MTISLQIQNQQVKQAIGKPFRPMNDSNSSLLYRPDIDAVRDRLTTWWHGGDIGRPILLLWYPRAALPEAIEELPPQTDFKPPYDWRYPEYRLNWAWRAAAGSHWMGETIPYLAPDLGPGCLALYLGSHGTPDRGTTWITPCIDNPDSARFEFDPNNPYWTTSLDLARRMRRLARGRFLLHFPGLQEGLDTLAAMRGSEALLYDLVERPEWVHRSLTHITNVFFRYYDRLYDLLRDERGGSLFWLWAPGRLLKLQCDVSAMIGPDHFAEFMVPVLDEMSARVSYSLYHWDGPQALVHKRHILALNRVSVIQWEPGAGAAPAADRTWWPVFHEILDAGKRVYISCHSLPALRDLKQEFGRALNRFVIVCGVPSKEKADEVVDIVSN